MESEFKLRIAPKEMSALFEKEPIKWFEIIGKDKAGDLPIKAEDAEWHRVFDPLVENNVKCLYKVRYRHRELKSYIPNR